MARIEDSYSFSDDFMDFLTQASAKDITVPEADSEEEGEPVGQEESDEPEEDWEAKYNELQQENDSLKEQYKDYRYSDNEAIQNDDLLYEKYNQPRSNSSVLDMILNDEVEATTPYSPSTTGVSSLLWAKTKSNSVNVSGTDGRLASYLDKLPEPLKKKVLVTSGNDQKHAKNSLHYGNKAVDMRYVPEIHDYIKNDPLAQKMGISVLNPNHGTAPHTHVQVK